MTRISTPHSRSLPRGIFLNTGKANCSIYESGRMVHECIMRSDRYTLEYLSLDMIDLALFAKTGRIQRIDEGATGDVYTPDYDFWVVNWHFVTMASFVPTAVLDRLSGLKLSIVLELAPGDPLALIPAEKFDGFMALEPDVERTTRIFPFPRPLEGDPRHPPKSAFPSRPVIGSFGLDTPGKGFELLIEAVNREFEQATVRINMPHGTYTAHPIHATAYAGRIGELCKRIAKPGIEVVFTHDFFKPEEVIDWCAGNDLNCFMYTRQQPGLSATTDQAIISGRPLLTLANETFRHIHQYIPPYPEIGLRRAIETTTEAVARMQRDWSKQRFRERFEEMLGSFGVLSSSSAAATEIAPSEPYIRVLHAQLDCSYQNDILHYSRRLSDALERTGKWRVTTVPCPSTEELRAVATALEPEIVILSSVDSIDRAALADALRDIPGPIIVLTEDLATWPSGPFAAFPKRPIIPFQTVTTRLRSPTTIWLIGFGDPASRLETAVRKIASELPSADIIVEAPATQRDAIGARVQALKAALAEQPSLQISLQSLPANGAQVIEAVASASLIVIHHDPARAQEIESYASLSMITERAVVFTRGAPHIFTGHGVVFEDATVPEMIEMGIAAQIKLLADLGEWQIAADIRALCRNLQPRAGDGPVGSLLGSARWKPGTRTKTAANILSLPGDKAFLHAAYWALLGRPPDDVSSAQFLSQLRQGRRRSSVLIELNQSAEARKRGAVLPGIDAVVQREQKTASDQDQTKEGLLRSLRSLEHRVYRLKTEAAAVASTPLSIVLPPLRFAASDPLSRIHRVHKNAVPTLSAVSFVAASEFGRVLTKPQRSPAPRLTERCIFVLAGLYAGRLEGSSAEIRQFSRAWGDLARVRMVLWDTSLRKLRIFDDQASSSSGLACDSLDKNACPQGSWLIAPQSITPAPGTTDLLVVDVIMEAHSLGLSTAFVFHGAEALRRPEDACPSASACDSYIQGLLLADIVLPVSREAADDLVAIFTKRHFATWGPIIKAVDWPGTGPGLGGWSDYARVVNDILYQVADPARRIKTLNYWIDNEACPDEITFAVQLAHTLDELGVALIPIAWNAGTRSLTTASDAPAFESIPWGNWCDPATVAPDWIVAATGMTAGLKEAAGFISSSGVRLAVLTASRAGESMDPAALSPSQRAKLEALTQADKVLALSERHYQDIYRFLLSWRGKILSAEDRFKVLVAPNEEPEAMDLSLTREAVFRPTPLWTNFAQELLIELATDRLQDACNRLDKSDKDVYEVFPNLVRQRPKLSVCLSTYNRAGWVRRNLENIYSQISSERKDVEVFVIDNASPDKTPDVVEPYLQKLNFRYHRNARNVGMLGNLAVAAQRARGEYIWILGDDDLTRAGCINKVLDVLHQHPGIGLVYMNYGYTSEPNPLSITDLPAFLDAYNILEPPGPDELASVKQLAAKSENFYTAIYCQVYRRDHGMRAYCQNTSGRPFSTMLTCIPTSYYVLHYMPDEPAYWIGEPSLVVNSNVSWVDYGPLFDLEQLPRAWDLAERNGTDGNAIDRRRANRLWLVELMWKDIFENDRAGNSPWFSAPRVLMRLKHLPDIKPRIKELREIYTRAHHAGHPAARMMPEQLFSAFSLSVSAGA